MYEILVKANKQIFMDYDVNMTNLTILGLAVRIFLKDYYDNNIPSISQASIYRDIKQAYYGGITEVYTPLGYNLFYYDVNSLYPYVSLLPMPDLIGLKITHYNVREDIDKFFGFFYCKIENPKDSYLGLLSVRDLSGLIYPLGKWEGWYFSEKLKYAKENGYKIQVLKGYNFDKQANVFTKYVDKIYAIKSSTKDKRQRTVAKSLLNNLLGRFGINIEKTIIDVISQKDFDRISVMNKISSYKNISNNKIMVSYVPNLDPEIIASHNLDFIKLVNRYNDKEVQNFNVTSVATVHLM